METTVRRLDAASISMLDPIRGLSRRPEPDDQRERRTPWNPDRTGDFASPFLDLPIEQRAFQPPCMPDQTFAVWMSASVPTLDPIRELSRRPSLENTRCPCPIEW
jgi:hypothetical protein